jgi:hypothetical protein
METNGAAHQRKQREPPMALKSTFSEEAPSGELHHPFS